MTKLSDIQLILLSTACQRADGSLRPPSDALGDQTLRIRKAITALIKADLASEVEITDKALSWRQADGVPAVNGSRLLRRLSRLRPMPPARSHA